MDPKTRQEVQEVRGERRQSQVLGDGGRVGGD